MAVIHTLLTHENPDLDATLCIWLLRRFGRERYPGIEATTLQFCPAGVLPEGKTPEQLEDEGILALDTGGGRMDTHARDGVVDERKKGMAAASLVAADLGVHEHPDLEKLLFFVTQAETRGRSLSSHDPVDHLVSLPNILRGFNTLYSDQPQRVVDLMLEVYDAIHATERDWFVALEDYKAAIHKPVGKARLVGFVSDSSAILKVARHHKGDLLIHLTTTGQTGITLRHNGPLGHLDLRELAAVLRVAEAGLTGEPIVFSELTAVGMNHGWYLHDSGKILSKGSAKNRKVTPTRMNLPELLSWAATWLDKNSPPPLARCTRQQGGTCEACPFFPGDLPGCQALQPA